MKTPYWHLVVELFLSFCATNSYAGGGDGSTVSNTIFQFDPISEIWNYFGSIKHVRRFSAVELVKYDEYSQYCANSRAGNCGKIQKEQLKSFVELKMHFLST